MIKLFKSQYFFLVLILLLSFFVRLYKLTLFIQKEMTCLQSLIAISQI